MADKVSVGHVLLNFLMGGMENMFLSFLEALDARRFASTIYCVDDVNDATHVSRVRHLEEKGFEVVRFQKTTVRPDLIWKLAQRFRDHHVVHSHNISPHIYAAAAARLAGVPAVIMTRHGAVIERRLVPWFKYTEALTDMIVAVSNPVETMLLGFHTRPSKIEVIYNGIDVESFHRDAVERSLVRSRKLAEAGIRDDEFVIGTVGRLVKEKDHATLLDAFQLLRERYPQVALVIIGDGVCRPDIERRITENHLGDAVHLLLERTDVPEWLNAFDVFVLSSISEGMPLVLLEAMAAERAVVATRVGGNPDVVVHGDTGMLVPKRDPSAMAQALGPLIENEQAREALAASGYRRARDVFSADAMARRYESLYLRLLGQRAA